MRTLRLNRPRITEDARYPVRISRLDGSVLDYYEVIDKKNRQVYELLKELGSLSRRQEILSSLSPADTIIMRRLHSDWSDPVNFSVRIQTILRISDPLAFGLVAESLTCPWNTTVVLDTHTFWRHPQRVDRRRLLRHPSRNMKNELEAIQYLARVAVYRLKQELISIRRPRRQAMNGLMMKIGRTWNPETTATGPFYSSMRAMIEEFTGEKTLSLPQEPQPHQGW